MRFEHITITFMTMLYQLSYQSGTAGWAQIYQVQRQISFNVVNIRGCVPVPGGK